MAGLRSTLELEATTYGRRLVDRASGAVLPLSDLEAKLLQQWTGTETAVALAAQLVARGVSVEASQVAAIFRRLDRIGLLAVAPPSAAGLRPPAAGLDAPGDTVPRFRDDLLVDPAPEVRGVMQVTDPLTSRTFTLYDFELSIARMLDGRRKARDLLAGADVIGVTVTLASLQAFLQQLRAWRFLEQAPPATATTWRPRRPWSDEVRELYQQALRLARRGQAAEALSCLESVLEVDPENEEAPMLVARLSSARAGQQALGVGFEVLHGDSSPARPGPSLKPDLLLAQGDPFDDFEPVTDPALRAVSHRARGPALWPTETAPALDEPPAEDGPASGVELPPEAPELPGLQLGLPGEQSPPDDEPEREDPPRRPRGALVAGLAVLVAALAGLLFPVAVTQEVRCTLSLVERARVNAPADGTFVFLVASNLPVKQGDVVARVTPRPDRAAATALELKLKGLQARRAGLAEAPPARVREAKRALAAAQAAVDPLLKQHARLEGQKGPAVRKKLAAVDKALKPKLAALEKAKAGLEAATHAVARAELEAALARARTEQEAFTAAAGPVTVVSPAAGVLLWNPGQPPEVTSGTTLGQVVAPDLKVSLGDEAAEPGAVMVTVSGVAQEARAGRDGLSVEGGPALAGKPCTARLPGGRQPFVLTLF